MSDLTLDISVYGTDTDELLAHLEAIVRHLSYKPAGIDFYANPAVQGAAMPVHSGVTKSKRPRKVGTIRVTEKEKTS